MAQKKILTFDYEHLAKVAGLTLTNLYQKIHDGEIDVGDLRSVAYFIVGRENVRNAQKICGDNEKAGIGSF